MTTTQATKNDKNQKNPTTQVGLGEAPRGRQAPQKNQPNSDDDWAKLRASLENPPDEYEEQSDDVEGFWLPQVSPIHCVPLGAKLFDGSKKTNERKASVLIIVRLLAPCAVQLKDEKKKAVKGQLVGIWGKPGMKAIRNLAGANVVIRLTGKTIDTGKANPMVAYSVKAKKGTQRSPLPILEDRRDKSRDDPTFLGAPELAPQEPDGPEDDSDIPF